MPANPEPCKTLNEALVALQAQLPRIPKTGEAQVGTRTYRYANLAVITDLLMPIMASLGLAFTARPTQHTGGFVLRYTLHHVSGDEISGEYPLPASGTPQQIGSAITYARRYALTAVTGIAPADDDDDAAAAEHGAQDDAKRDAAGRMTRAQREDHAAVRQLDHPRPAERTRGPAADDPWTGPAPEDKPGSSVGPQHQKLGILYGQLGITDRASRLHDMTDRLGREVTSAKDLSYSEAESAIRALRDLVAAERGAEGELAGLEGKR